MGAENVFLSQNFDTKNSSFFLEHDWYTLNKELVTVLESGWRNLLNPSRPNLARRE